MEGIFANSISDGLFVSFFHDKPSYLWVDLHQCSLQGPSFMLTCLNVVFFITFPIAELVTSILYFFKFQLDLHIQNYWIPEGFL